MNLHCNQCAWIGNSGGVAHVQDNPTHVVTGQDKEGNTIRISISK